MSLKRVVGILCFGTENIYKAKYDGSELQYLFVPKVLKFKLGFLANNWHTFECCRWSMSLDATCMEVFQLTPSSF